MRTPHTVCSHRLKSEATRRCDETRYLSHASRDRSDFDLVAVGRALIANPAWPQLIRNGAVTDLVPFDKAKVGDTLY